MATTAIHQLIPTLSWGDAVGNMVRAWQAAIRGWGFRSEIFAGLTDERSKAEARPSKEYPQVADADSVLLVHHSIASGELPMLRRAPGRKAVVYHNITPGHFFEGHERHLVRACESGRDELYQLAEVAERGFAYARFSGEELRSAGFEQVDRVPFLIDWAKFDAEPDPSLLAELGDGCFNLLFVGRVVPNKRLEDVIRAFTAFQRFYHPRSRLVVAGALDAHSPYVAGLRALAAQLRPERIRWLGRVTQAQLSACYATASVYLSMSQHEGFGVPLVEAMHRGVPVVAYGAAAVPETMGGAGITTLVSDPLEVAKLLAVVDRDRSVRERLVARERARATDFEPDRTLPRLKEALAPFLGRPPPRVERPSRPQVLIVAPGLEARPEEPLSRAARSLAELLGARADVELLTLKADGWPAEMGPEVTREGRVTVSRFSPEGPLEQAEEALPRSSSLQSRVRASKEPVVFFGGRQAVALAVLPRVGERAFVVDLAGTEPPPEAKALGARRHAASAEGLDDAVQAVAAQVRARLEQGGSRGA